MAGTGEIDAEVRRYLTRLALRYVPGVLVLSLLVVTIALVPAKQASQNAAGSGAPSDQLKLGGGAGSAPKANSGSATVPGQAAGAASGPATSATSQSSQGPTAADSSMRPGVARSGVTCGAGVRQVSWSKYAPMCVPAYTGSNGGATTFGVTGTTITVTFRVGNPTETSGLKAMAGDGATAIGADQQQVLSDMRTYVDLFNKTFELYGRKVVLKSYDGSSSVLAEDSNQGAAGAQQDAATAKSLGAFADVSQPTVMTQQYAEALVAQKITTIGPQALSQHWFEAHAPYAYASTPTGDRFGAFMGNTACMRMAGLPAAYSGSATTRTTPRVFGIINPENPEFSHIGDVLEGKLSGCGQRVAARAQYAMDPSTGASQLANAMAQMQTAGVTTVLCACEMFAPIYLTKAADQQQYFPEWLSIGWPDPWGRQYTQSQWSHAMGTRGVAPQSTGTEAYRAYKLANKAGPPSGDTFIDIAYRQVLTLFLALQGAGPQLTPASMANGWFSLPPSLPGGDLGPWVFGRDVYTPQAGFQLGWWSASAGSGYDGKAGSWRDCAGKGRWYPFNDPAALGPRKTQPGCFA